MAIPYATVNTDLEEKAKQRQIAMQSGSGIKPFPLTPPPANANTQDAGLNPNVSLNLDIGKDMNFALPMKYQNAAQANGYQPVAGLTDVYKKGNSYADNASIQAGLTDKKAGLSILPAPETAAGLDTAPTNETAYQFRPAANFSQDQIQGLIGKAMANTAGSVDAYRQSHQAAKMLDNLLGFNTANNRMVLDSTGQSIDQNNAMQGRALQNKQMGLNSALDFYKAQLGGQADQMGYAEKLAALDNQRLATLQKGQGKLMETGTDPNTGQKSYARQTDTGLELVPIRQDPKTELDTKAASMEKIMNDPSVPMDKREAARKEIMAIQQQMAQLSRG